MILDNQLEFVLFLHSILGLAKQLVTDKKFILFFGFKRCFFILTNSYPGQHICDGL